MRTAAALRVSVEGGMEKKEMLHLPHKTHMIAYANANQRDAESWPAYSSEVAIVDSRRPMERYEMNVRSLANQTLDSTFTGVAFFSVVVRRDLEGQKWRCWP